MPAVLCNFVPFPFVVSREMEDRGRNRETAGLKKASSTRCGIFGGENCGHGFWSRNATFCLFLSIGDWSSNPMPGVNLTKATAQSNNGIAQMKGETRAGLHPAWQAMIRFCREMGYGEIACIKIHDGLPISAEVVTKKVRWY